MEFSIHNLDQNTWKCIDLSTKQSGKLVETLSYSQKYLDQSGRVGKLLKRNPSRSDQYEAILWSFTCLVMISGSIDDLIKLTPESIAVDSISIILSLIDIYIKFSQR